MLITKNNTQKILCKAEYWKLHEQTPINERQRLIPYKLIEDFVGKLQTSKWDIITKSFTYIALQDIYDSVKNGILKQSDKGGRNANCKLVDLKWL
jgi:hypothetical protein